MCTRKAKKCILRPDLERNASYPRTFIFSCGCRISGSAPPKKFRGLVVCPEHNAMLLYVQKHCAHCGVEMKLEPRQSKRALCRSCRKKEHNKKCLEWSRKTRKGKDPLTEQNIIRMFENIRYIPPADIVPESIPGTKPVTRQECKSSHRPCPWISCQFHMFWCVNQIDRILQYLPDHTIADIALSLSQTCVLDVTDTGEKTLEEIGDILQVSRERIRQIEEGAINKISAHKLKYGIIEDFIGTD